VDQLQPMNGFDEVSELEAILIKDGHDEVRREIVHLQATLKALAALLPHPDRQ